MNSVKIFSSPSTACSWNITLQHFYSA